MDIYIKPKKKITVSKTGYVTLNQISDILAKPNIKENLKNMVIINIKESSPRHNVISVIDIISKITSAYSDATVNNLGETDTLIEYAPETKNTNNIIMYLKTAIICIILFAGASTAIISFHSDAQMKVAFEKYYHIFFNEKEESPAIICLPYSIGLAIGIIVFFNHFCGKNISKDPTPIQVEMSLYEKDLDDNIIQTNENKKGGG